MMFTTREQQAEATRVSRLLMREPINQKELSYAINCLPLWLRDYIHDIETRCDPAGEVRDLWVCRQEHKALQRKIDELERELESAHGGMNTGDIEYASIRLEAAKAEQRALPAKEFKRLFDFVHGEMNCYVQRNASLQYDRKPWCVLDADGEVVARGESPLSAMAELERMSET